MSAAVLVTGGAGFIGSATTARLGAEGYDARAGVRRLSRRPNEILCDLDKPAQLAAAASGVDVIVHAAYGASAAMERQCADLLEAMDRASVRALVYLSSVAVYGDANGVVTEDAPMAPLDAYGAAKVACEARVRAWARARGANAVILRPGVVYGKGSAFWIDKLATRIRVGAWGTFGEAGEGVAPLLHVDDLAALIALAVGRLLSGPGAAPVMTLNVVGDETPTWNAYFRALAAALRAPAPVEIGPRAMAWRRRLAPLAKVLRRAGAPGFEAAALAPTAGETALFARKSDYRSGAAQRALGWSPRVSMNDGLSRSM